MIDWDWRAVVGFAPSSRADGTLGRRSVGSVLSFEDEYEVAAMEADVEKLLHALAKDGSRRHSKKDRRTQRAAFRDYHATYQVRLGGVPLA